MKLRHLFIIFLLLISIPVSIESLSKQDINFHLGINVSTAPCFYLINNTVYGTSIEASIMGGINMKHTTIGLQALYYSQISLDSYAITNIFWYHISGAIIGQHTTSPWFSIHWGLGGTMIYASIDDLDYDDIYNYYEAGFLVYTNFLFSFPFRYISLEQTNRLDLIFNSTNIYPNYKGGLRLIFHPKVEWIDLYLGVYGSFINYSKTGAFVLSGAVSTDLGITIDLQFPKLVRDYKAYKKNRVIVKDVIVIRTVTPDGENDPEDIDISDEISLMAIEQLKTGEINTVIYFPNVNFVANSPKLTSDSYPYLNQIVSVLLEKSSIKIAIGAYVEYSGGPIRDMELSVMRAKNIKGYFVKTGVADSRIKLLASTNLYNADKHKQPYIEVKIIEE